MFVPRKVYRHDSGRRAPGLRGATRVSATTGRGHLVCSLSAVGGRRSRREKKQFLGYRGRR